MARKRAPKKGQRDMFDSSPPEKLSTGDFMTSIPSTPERMRQATRQPVCVVCNKPGVRVHSQLCGGSVHEECAEKVKEQCRKDGSFVETVNRNAGCGNAEPREWKVVRKVSAGDSQVEQVMMCSFGCLEITPEGCEAINTYIVVGTTVNEDVRLKLEVYNEKVDIANIMFRAALESVGFKEVR